MGVLVFQAVLLLLLLLLLLSNVIVLVGGEQEENTTECRLCPTGMDPPNPDVEVVGGLLGLLSLTCGNVDGVLSGALGSDSIACSIVQSTYGVEVCQCPPSENDACTLCPAGESPNEDLLDSVPVNLSFLGLPEITCQDLVDDENTLDCNFVGFLRQACECGVEQEVVDEQEGGSQQQDEDEEDDAFVDDILVDDEDGAETCSLCENGERPASVLDLIPIDLSAFGLPDLTCLDLYNEGDLDCATVAFFVRPFCGCGLFNDDDENEEAETCTLCEQGDRPADVTDLFPIDLSGLGLPDLSCNQLFEAGEINCGIVDVARPLCGCGVFTDDQEEETCMLCEEGDRPAELADLVPLPFASLFLPQVSCSQLFDAGQVECALVNIARPLCGCGLFEDNRCTLCAEGDRPASVSDVIRIDLSQFGLPELSCNQLFHQDEIDCDVAALARPLCGCGVFNDDQELCSLCQEGDRPADVADLVQVDLSSLGIPELSCNQLWQENQVDCGIVDIARPICGCGVFSDEKCSLCEQGERPAQVQDLVDLSALDLPELSCNQLFQDGEIDCAIVDIARPLCGCGVFEGEPDPDPLIELCPLCDEGRLPLPSLADVVPFDLSIFGLEQLTCSQLFGNPNLPCAVAEVAGKLCGCGFFQSGGGGGGDGGDFVCRDSRPREKFPIRKKLRGPNVEKMTCGKLSVQAALEEFAGAVGGEVDFYCFNFPRVRNNCRLTCRNCRRRNNGEDCADNADLQFPSFTSVEKNCRSLARIPSEARKGRICRQNVLARIYCPVTCGECLA